MPLDSIAVLSPLDRATDANGDPVPGAVLYFYEAGTSTPKTVYSDSDLTQSLGTSVVCDAGGFPTSDGSTRVMIYTGTAAYKLVVKDADGVTLWTLDDIPGAPVIPDVASAALPETPVISRTSSYQIVPGDKGKLINADPTGGSFAITLPSAVTVGDKWRIGVRHNGPATANVVAVRSTGGQTIQGPGQTAATSMALTGLGQCFWFVSDGAGWTIDGSAEPLMASGGVVYFKATDRLSAPPSSPVGGQRYIINSTPTGVWATLGFAEKDIAESDGNGSWLKYTPANGYMAWVDDENLISVYHDGAWEDWSNVTAPQSSALNVLELYYDGSGTNTIAATTWTKLLHNATAKNSITGASVSSGAVTLPTGNYLVFGSFSALIPQSVGVNVRGRFYSTTNSAVKIGSVNNRNANVASQNVAANPHFFGFVGVTSATETFEHQWWSTSNQVTLATTDTGSTGAITDRFAILTILKLDAVQGPRGAQGLQGVDGLDAAYAYQWDTGTSGDPGSGKVGLNNATPASATQLRISETDAYGANLSAVFATWDDSTSSIKARVKISKEGATQNFVEALITGAGTDQGAYWTFPITYVAAGGTISASNNVAVIVIEKGDKGDSGSTGPTGSTSFTFDPLTADSDPGSGKLRLNNATAASATVAYIDNNNRGGSDVSAWLDTFDDFGVSAGRGQLCIFDAAAPTTVFRIFNITGSVVDGTGYRKVTIAHVTGAGSFTNGNELVVSFFARGQSGSGDLTSANNLSDVASVATARANLELGRTSRALPSGNFNNATSNGWYWSNNTDTNGPTADFYFVEVVDFNSGWKLQRATNITNGAIYQRIYNGGTTTWGSWTGLITTTVELGATTDTTLSRDSAGVLAVEGVPLYSQIPQNSQSTAYTLVLADAQKHILHPTADNNARTFTIPANASVAYPVGTCLTFVNQINTVTIAINSDTLTLAGAGSTGSRTLAANGIATALKIASTSWIISGTGLT